MRTEVQAVAWRSYWPVALLAVTFLLVVSLFGTYLTTRQHLADARTERQRRAICAILANIPGRIPPEIVRARAVFARPGHPGDCQPIVHPAAKRTIAPTPAPAPTATVIIVNPGARATATITARPSPTPRPSPRPKSRSARQPIPAPSPSRTCVLTICTGGLNAGRPIGAAATRLRLLLALPRPDKRRPTP